MCGRRVIEKEYPQIKETWGFMDFRLLKQIQKQLPEDITIQFHNNGEPLLYPRLQEALQLFPNNIRCLDTNGKLLEDKASELVGNLDTITISVFEGDPEQDEQYELVQRFLDIRGDNLPRVIFRLLGNVHSISRWEELPGIVCTRVLHHPLGSHSYEKRVTIPEIGVCQDLLHKLCIDRFGNISFCVRFDPHGYGCLGNMNESRLIDVWYGEKRKALIREHIKGDRSYNKLCGNCDFYGVPTGY